MIPVSRTDVQAMDKIPWQKQLSSAINSVDQLLAAVQLDLKNAPYTVDTSNSFDLRATQSFVARMRNGNWHDPLLLQVLPQGRENISAPNYSADPLAESSSNPVPGLVHKYKSRALLITTGSCAINCRYCFRREFPYEDNRPKRSEWQLALNYVAQHPEINEVILSGGDPLVASDAYLADLVQRIAKIAHIKYLRVHSRLPIVLPARVTAELISAINSTRLKATVVVHANHANEINDEVRVALQALQWAGITTLNQSVLLKGVNDSVQILSSLSDTLFQAGVMPYYLHVLDKVKGAQHFDCSEEDALKLHRGLQAELSGFLVPKLVREVPGERHKTLLGHL